MIPVPLGAFVFGAECTDAMLGWPGGGWSLDAPRDFFSAVGPWALVDAPGGREELRELVDPRLRDILDELPPAECSTALAYVSSSSLMGSNAPCRFHRPDQLVWFFN
jgi:hypothetical protein